MADASGIRAEFALGRQREFDPVLVRAAECFDRVGYERVTVREIARTARISTETLYRRFSGKRGLLTAITRSFARGLALEVDALAGRPDEPALRSMCEVVGWGGQPTTSPVAVLLVAFVRLCARNGPLVRVALAARDHLWSRCDAEATALLAGAVRTSLLTPRCADLYVEQVLALFGSVAQSLRPKSGSSGSLPSDGQARDPGVPALPSEVGACLRILATCAQRDSRDRQEPGWRERGDGDRRNRRP